MAALILTRWASVGWLFSTSESYRAASKSKKSASGDIMLELACQRGRECPVRVC